MTADSPSRLYWRIFQHPPQIALPTPDNPDWSVCFPHSIRRAISSLPAGKAGLRCGRAVALAARCAGRDTALSPVGLERSEGNRGSLPRTPLQLGAQFLDLALQRVVFRALPRQEPPGDRALGGHSAGGEDVGVAALVGGLAETVELDEAAFDQPPQHVVRRAEADAEFVRQVALREVRVALDQAHHLELGFFARPLALDAHRRASAIRLPHGASLQAHREDE